MATIHRRFGSFNFKLVLIIIIYGGARWQYICCTLLYCLFLVLPFARLHVTWLHITCLWSFTASADKWKSKVFLLRAAVAALLRKIVLYVHHSESWRRWLNLWRLVIHFIMVRRISRRALGWNWIVIPTGRCHGDWTCTEIGNGFCGWFVWKYLRGMVLKLGIVSNHFLLKLLLLLLPISCWWLGVILKWK